MRITAWLNVDAATETPVVRSRDDLDTSYVATTTPDVYGREDELHISGTVIERAAFLTTLADAATAEAARLLAAEAAEVTC